MLIMNGILHMIMKMYHGSPYSFQQINIGSFLVDNIDIASEFGYFKAEETNTNVYFVYELDVDDLDISYDSYVEEYDLLYYMLNKPYPIKLIKTIQIG